jgi:hypothetical protein
MSATARADSPRFRPTFKAGKTVRHDSPFYNAALRSLSELAMTLTEDKDMAAAATMGERSMPENG